MDKAFIGYHPIVIFLFFIGAIVMGMFFIHPVLIFVSVFTSILYYILLAGKNGARFLLGIFVLFICIALINPFFNTLGDTVLFSYWGGRRFTLEALLYGMATGGMFLSIIIWFACYNIVMSSDKFIYLFGRYVPTVSLLLSMVLRLVPNFKIKTRRIISERQCVGKGFENSPKKLMIKSSMDVLSVLTSCALEGAMVMADSMRSRGYGSGKRSLFSIYKFTIKDVWALCIMLASLMLVITGAISGGVTVVYYPTIMLQKGMHTAISVTGYTLFLTLPSIIHIWEEATWHILRSRV